MAVKTSHSQVFFRIGVLKNFPIFTGLFLIKLTGSSKHLCGWIGKNLGTSMSGRYSEKLLYMDKTHLIELIFHSSVRNKFTLLVYIYLFRVINKNTNTMCEIC